MGVADIMNQDLLGPSRGHSLYRHLRNALPGSTEGQGRQQAGPGREARAGRNEVKTMVLKEAT